MACPIDRPYPSIRLDDNNNMVAACSIADWMLNPPFKEQVEDTILTFLRDCVEHWSKDQQKDGKKGDLQKHIVQLWRWLYPVARAEFLDYQYNKQKNVLTVDKPNAVFLRLHFIEQMSVSPVFFPFQKYMGV